MSTEKESSQKWSIADANKYYGLSNWGKDHFKIDQDGFLEVYPYAGSKGIRLIDVVEEAKSKGFDLPLTIRIQDLLRTKVRELNTIFRDVIK